MKPRNQVDDEKSMKGRKVKGEKVVQVVAAAALGVSCIVCAIGICSMNDPIVIKISNATVSDMHY